MPQWFWTYFTISRHMKRNLQELVPFQRDCIRFFIPIGQFQTGGVVHIFVWTSSFSFSSVQQLLRQLKIDKFSEENVKKRMSKTYLKDPGNIFSIRTDYVSLSDRTYVEYFPSNTKMCKRIDIVNMFFFFFQLNVCYTYFKSSINAGSVFCLSLSEL